MIRQTMPGVQARKIREVFRPGDPGYWAHPEWEERFPWLAQGTTGRRKSKGMRVRDFARFTDPPGKGARHAWAALASRLDFPKVAHSRQTHGKAVTVYEGLTNGDLCDAGLSEDLLDASEVGVDGNPNLVGRMILGPDADGHVTASEGVLLGVTVADCVPVFIVDPERRVVSLLHAGWRGAVAGVLDHGLRVLAEEFGSRPDDLFLHLGPAICGDCYEVGPEVHAALGLAPAAAGSPVDLRQFLEGRAIDLGVAELKVTRSAWCTLCGDSPFFSHRRGDRARQVGFLGIRLSEDS